MSRKDTLRGLLAERAQLSDDEADLKPGIDRPPAPLLRVGAVGAMSRTLGNLAQAAETTRALVASGDVVLELSPDVIESSFLSDRLAGDQGAHEALVDSIKTSGQQVPILVRPHPKKPGHYQVAFGHRRLRAARALGRSVRAVVKKLTDEELVVAQGQENSARMELSYIERARFAMALEDAGFGREIVMAALSVEKTQLSKLVAVARAIPAEITTAIGPAPKTGRPKWMELAAGLQDSNRLKAAKKAIGDARFSALSSDGRFLAILGAVTTKAIKDAQPADWVAGDGRRVAKYHVKGERFVLEIDEAAAPKFGQFLIENLAGLYGAFCDRSEGAPSKK